MDSDSAAHHFLSFLEVDVKGCSVPHGPKALRKHSLTCRRKRLSYRDVVDMMLFKVVSQHPACVNFPYLARQKLKQDYAGACEWMSKYALKKCRDQPIAIQECLSLLCLAHGACSAEAAGAQQSRVTRLAEKPAFGKASCPFRRALWAAGGDAVMN